MPKTAFVPETDGFAFGNWWEFTEAERRWLHAEFAKALTLGQILGTAALGAAGSIAVVPGIRAIRKRIETTLSEAAFGLCGGMSFAALDYFRSPRSVPRGNGPRDWPPPGDPLREHIWLRQVDSFVSDLARLYAWVILLNYVPKSRLAGGRAGGLLARTKKEWDKLKTEVDAGNPVPLMLVRDTKDAFENHQVLATGYEPTGTNQGVIYLYDPNCPDRESTIDVDLSGSQLDAEESCAADHPLRGFFCQRYAPKDPPGAEA